MGEANYHHHVAVKFLQGRVREVKKGGKKKGKEKKGKQKRKVEAKTAS